MSPKNLPVLVILYLVLTACGGAGEQEVARLDPDKLQLQAPSGPYEVGVVDFEFTDDSREEVFHPGVKRRIPARAWFPASKVDGEPRLYATPDELELQIKFLLGVTGQTDALAAYENVPTHAYEDATPIDAGPLPTVVFSHGGFAFLQTNTAQMEHLASHGYLVISITHPSIAAPTIHANGDVTQTEMTVLEGLMSAVADSDYMDAYLSDDIGVRLDAFINNAENNVLAPHFIVWEEDFMHVIDRLESGDLPDAARPLLPLVDIDRIGTFGMSFGASGSAAAHKDDRVKAAVNIDGGVFDPDLVDIEVRMPVLVFHNDTTLAFPGQKLYPHSEFVYESLKTTGSRNDVIRLEILGSTHSGHTDGALLPQSVRDSSPLPNAGLGTIDGQRMVDIMNDFIKAFFDYHLSGEGNGVDVALRSEYPEAVDVDLSNLREWATTEKPGFMSRYHVMLMNRRLAVDEASLAECAKLDRRYTMVYELTDGPDGEIVWWQLSFDPETGVRFDLDEPAEAGDLTFKGDWAAMIRATAESATNPDVEIPLTPEGDISVSQKTAAAFEAARGAATIETEMPDV